jgi:Tfp pilus assembly protein PilV
MIAVVLLTVGVLTLTAEMGVLVGRQVKATSSSEMTTLGESKLEELRSYAMLESVSKAQVALGGSLTVSQADHFDLITAPSGRQYTRRWLVEAGPGGTVSVSLRVSATTATRHVPLAADFNTLMLVVP